MRVSKKVLTLMIMFLLFLPIFSIPRQVNTQPMASLVGVVYDGGVDTDEDGTFDYLDVGVEVDVVTAGTFMVEVYGLFDSEYNVVNVGNQNMSYLDVGVQVVYVSLDGPVIYASGFNPVSVSSIYLYDEYYSDLGYLDEEGFLFLIGRQAHWLRTGGENVACFEVENVINQNPKVAESAVVGVPAELGEEDVKAYVVLEEGELMEPLDVIKWCEDRLARFKVPRYIEFVMSLPKSITKSEIERHKLKKIGIGDAWDREKIGYKLKR